MKTTLVALIGDITKFEVDAIINAAKSSLQGGSGVDGAIHAAAGPRLLQECTENYPQGCDTGEAVMTDGHSLPADYVIHTVGPVWFDYSHTEADRLLARCYYSSLLLAAHNRLKSIAFPAISTGVYGFPTARAAQIAVKAVTEFTDNQPHQLEQVFFVCFDQGTLDAYTNELRGISWKSTK